jgi:acyl-CoA hydrolase
MAQTEYPNWFSDRIFDNKEAMLQTIKSGSVIGSGFATSEPHTFYDQLWAHIQENDIRDLNIKQALFMAPHQLCVGDALASKGLLNGLAHRFQSASMFANLAMAANTATKKIEGLKKLVDHYNELLERKIRFTSPFIGAATNILIPSNAVTKVLCPEFILKNTSRIGITDMHSIHFPEAVDSLGYDPDNKPRLDMYIAVMTGPNEDGLLSHGTANGANGEIIEKIINNKDMNLLLYLNDKYPFTYGYPGAENTFHIDRLKDLAKAGRLFVVKDDGKVPALPKDSFKTPGEQELQIAQHVVNHIEMNLAYTQGRAIQVGFGGTGVLAIKALKESSWTGRSYTEMLEPFTLDLYDAGKISGSHFIESDGRRTQLDGKMVCTFTICEEESGFYDRINNNDAVVVAPASRVVIPEGFYGGLGINNCLAVDFHGHVNSAGRFANHYSGIGGGAQIFRGLAKGGVGYLCLKSTHTSRDGKLVSSIYPFMPEGTPISHVGPDLMGGREGARLFIATEHGVAMVSGKSQSEFVKALIEIADPRFQDQLKHQAYKEFRISF